MFALMTGPVLFSFDKCFVNGNHHMNVLIEFQNTQEVVYTNGAYIGRQRTKFRPKNLFQHPKSFSNPITILRVRVRVRYYK